jgi:hypothetical protein
MIFAFRLMVHSPAAFSPKGILSCHFMEDVANPQGKFSKLTDLHFHRMIAVVIQQGDAISRERLTVEG